MLCFIVYEIAETEYSSTENDQSSSTIPHPSLMTTDDDQFIEAKRSCPLRNYFQELLTPKKLFTIES